MKITRLNHLQICIPRGMDEQARAFYCGVLGLPEIPKPESLAGRGGFWLALGDVQVHVSIEDGVDYSRTKAHVAYQVDDLDGWLAALKDHGIRPLDSVPIPGYARFEFRDPFGNRIEMIQPK